MMSAKTSPRTSFAQIGGNLRWLSLRHRPPFYSLEIPRQELRRPGGPVHPQHRQIVLADLAVDELLHHRMGVVADVVGVPVGDHFAVVQHDDAVRHLVGTLHVVRHDDAS